MMGLLPVSGAIRMMAEVCTTQSQMKEVDRTSIASAAHEMATRVQANDAAGLRAETVAEYAKDFSAIEYVVGSTAPKLKGATLVVDGVYLLDGTELKAAGGSGPGGAGTDAQFFCSLNRSTAETDFLIPGLTPGRYAFGVVEAMGGAAPWQIALLLRQEGTQWKMAGIYPKATTAAGHDGLWFWREARRMALAKQRWDAWLYFGEAEALLKPANFVQSTHLEKLHTEQAAAAPPALSDGVNSETPLVVRGKDGTEFRFTGLGVDDSLAKNKVDVAAHLKVEMMGDATVARQRNLDAMSALLAAYPEMRTAFHGVWIYAEATGQNPFATEQTMEEIR